MKSAIILASTLALVIALPQALPICPEPKDLLPWVEKSGTDKECSELESTKPPFKKLEQKCGTTFSCNVLSNSNEKWLIDESGFADDKACLARHVRDPGQQIPWYPKSHTDDECLAFKMCKPALEELEEQCGTDWTCSLLEARDENNRLENIWLADKTGHRSKKDCLRHHMPDPSL
ncbi:hypothetical protein E5D57_008321 [Metarhizium anisopliae]|nr:hypothetical protein E5D57_008321 [Metarhizium anisopliae]